MVHSHALPGVNYVYVEYILWLDFYFFFFNFYFNNIIYIEENKLKPFAKAGEISGGLQFTSES